MTWKKVQFVSEELEVKNMRWIRQFLSSATFSVTLMFGDVSPALATPTVPIPTAIDYVVQESMPSQNTPSSTPSKPLPALPITVVAKDYQFIPNVITVRTGQKIDLTLRNEGKAEHNLTFVNLPDKTETVPSGASTTLSLTAGAPGRYRFYCSVGDHKTRGMVGLLVVTH